MTGWLKAAVSRRRAAIAAALLVAATTPLFGVTTAHASLPAPVVVHGEGFDSSSLPSTTDMSDWWVPTPYSTVGVYIGGDESGSDSAGLSHSWLSTVMTQGWGVWLTWLGPQSPCDVGEYSNLYSENPNTAQSQGEAQAQQAVSAAEALGFSDFYVYYDMEAFGGQYATTSDGSSCATAAASFINGWEYEIHSVYGEHGGVYGSACSSDLLAYTTHSNVPEAVWAAEYNSADTPIFSTTGLGSCLPDNYWQYNQRLRQSTMNTGIRELSGQTASIPGWNIDEDCNDGPAQGTEGWDFACQ